ncbi:MAG: hypothetical protein QOF76_2392 [Solirubrobacteraceae bacterium]|nr:hypothetical protein [Solirubrobacteraceae bacterium]
MAELEGHVRSGHGLPKAGGARTRKADADLAPAGTARVRGLRGPSAAGDQVHAAADHGMSGPTSDLPSRPTIQRLFGRHDISAVQAHMDERARQGAVVMGAQAFARGEHLAFAGAPDLHTAAHEAAHVVQQRDGVQLLGGVGQAGDAYERDADAVAEQVVRGQSAEALLDQYAPGGTVAAPRCSRCSRSRA